MSRVARVVVADDRLPFRRAARSVLEAMPEFELVREVASGEEAVEAAASLAPDLVLMDVHMEGIGGLEATRRIVDESPDVAVILVSSYRVENLTALAEQAGALAFLPKDELGGDALRRLWSSRAGSPAPRGTREPPSPDG